MKYLLAILLIFIPSVVSAQTNPGVAASVPYAVYVGNPAQTTCTGTYTGSPGPNVYQASLGHPADYLLFYSVAVGTWTNFEGTINLALGCYKKTGAGQNIIASLGNIVGDGSTQFSTFEACAAGSYDTYWTYFANALLNNGYTKPIIRIDWEFNLGIFSWTPWVTLNGGSGSGAMANITYASGTATKANIPSTYVAGHNYVVGDVLTPNGGTYTTQTQLTVASVNVNGGITGLTLTTGGNYTVIPGPGDFIACWQDTVNAIKAVLPNAKIAWNPNITSAATGWNNYYPGDSFVDYLALDVYDQDDETQVVSFNTALANGTIPVVTNPSIADYLHITINSGSSPINGGSLTINYNKIGGGTQSDVFSLASNGEIDFYSSLQTTQVNSITVAGLSGGTLPKIRIWADSPMTRWNNLLTEPSGLNTLVNLGSATSNTLCSGSPSPCNGAINVTTGGSKSLGLGEWGLWRTTTLPANANDIGGGDNPYFINQMAIWIGAHASFHDYFEAYPNDAFGQNQNNRTFQGFYRAPASAAALVADFNSPIYVAPTAPSLLTNDTGSNLLTDDAAANLVTGQ
ncbi:MAG: hypothetical protein KGJ90_00415 [Patescibacteria group bacterium]|nr:hypothetical protein [Patescibacteria group bacterium]